MVFRSKVQKHTVKVLQVKSVKVDITHSAMEIDFQTSDHVVTMEKGAEQCISTK